MVTFIISVSACATGSEAPAALSFAPPLSSFSMHPAEKRARHIANMMTSFMKQMIPL
jgi:hypothetical protein